MYILWDFRSILSYADEETQTFCIFVLYVRFFLTFTIGKPFVFSKGLYFSLYNILDFCSTLSDILKMLNISVFRKKMIFFSNAHKNVKMFCIIEAIFSLLLFQTFTITGKRSYFSNDHRNMQTFYIIETYSFFFLFFFFLTFTRACTPFVFWERINTFFFVYPRCLLYFRPKRETARDSLA